MIKKCVYCGKEFNARQASRKFCSIPCRDNNRKKPLTLKCKNCGKEYTINKCKKRRKYCSLECVYEYQKKHSSIIKTCEYCKKEFTITHNKNRNKFCSKECGNKAKIKEF